MWCQLGKPYTKPFTIVPSCFDLRGRSCESGTIFLTIPTQHECSKTLSQSNPKRLSMICVSWKFQIWSSGVMYGSSDVHFLSSKLRVDFLSYPNLKQLCKKQCLCFILYLLSILQIGHAISQNGFISSLVQPLVAPSHEKLIFDPSRQLTMRGQNIKPLLYVTGYVCLFDFEMLFKLSLKATIGVITPGTTYCVDTRVKWELLQLGLIFCFCFGEFSF